MRIVYPYPAYWPYMRRGAERCIHDLSNYLAGKGHQVDIITSKPGAPRVSHDGAARVIYLKQFSHPLTYNYFPLVRLYAFGIAATRLMLQGNYDAAHLWSYSAIAIAPLLKRYFGKPYLFHLIMRKHQWPGRGDRWLFRQMIQHASRVAALTPDGASEIRAEYGVDAMALPPPVNMDTFQPEGPKDLTHPRVLFTGDLGDPRKGGPLLLKAWDKVHQQSPKAKLVLAGPSGLGFDRLFDVYTLERLHMVESEGARDAIEIPGVGALEDLPSQYRRAAVTVLPSIEEAFGIVLTESLASGTPVVCSSYDGPGEIVRTPDVGVTVPLKSTSDLMGETTAQQLADAILKAIDLSRKKATSTRCREWAENWSLDRVGALAETTLIEMAETRWPGKAPIPSPVFAWP
jgi:phosphatidylinositol alpha-mannosyltransferase